MMDSSDTTELNPPNWAGIYTEFADAVSAYKEPPQRERLLDLLADALDEYSISFPIMYSGENLRSIDPFTFFASFNWSYCPKQRSALISLLAERLGTTPIAKSSNTQAAYKADVTKNTSSISPTLYYSPSKQVITPGFLVNESEVRFFSVHEVKMNREIEVLWGIFLAALAFADNSSEENRSCFCEKYDELHSLRVSSLRNITTALHWVRPQFFLPINESMGDFLIPEFGYPEEFFTKTPRAEAYLQYVYECKSAIERGIFGERISSPAALTTYIQKASNPRPPFVDMEKTQRLLDDCVADLDEIHAKNAQLWRAVACFQKNWDPDAPDFYAMLKASLAEHGTLLSSSNIFNPYWELMKLCSKEPETLRFAFTFLFEPEIPLCTRLTRFEEITSMLFERHREDMIRVIPKRSAHGNYTAIATYLFLRFPDSTYLYSPLRINVIKRQVGYDTVIRVARPESVEQYYVLCKQITEQISTHPKLLEAAKQNIDPATEYPDPFHHLLTEDIISYFL